MSDHAAPNVDPTRPLSVLRAAAGLTQAADFAGAGRMLGWALDFNPQHPALLRAMSTLRWEEAKEAEAVVWAEQALAADRGDADSYAHLALLRMRMGRLADAAALLAHALELRPERAGLLGRLAEVEMRLGHGEEAVDLAERAVALQPYQPASYLGLAGLQRRRGDLTGAEATVQAALRQAPDDVPLLQRAADLRLAAGDRDGVRGLADRLVEIAPGDPAIHGLKAHLAMMDGDLAGAEQALREAVSADLAAGMHQRRLSEVLLRRGDREGALAWAATAATDHPEQVGSHLHLASTLVALGRPRDAARALEAAITQVRGRNQALILMRRRAHLALQDRDQATAEDWAQKALKADVTDPESHALLATLHLSAGDLDAAAAAAGRAVALAPGVAAHLRRLSEVTWRQGDIEKAMDLAEQALALQPSDVGSHLHLAVLFLRQGQDEAAEPVLRRVMELAPASPGPVRHLSALRLRAGDVGEAFALAEQALSMDPHDVASLSHLAALHQQMGNLEDAYAILDRALAVAPDNANIQRRREALARHLRLEGTMMDVA